MILQVGIIFLAYLVLKVACAIVNENEKIKITIPKILERVSIGVMAFSSQVIFF